MKQSKEETNIAFRIKTQSSRFFCNECVPTKLAISHFSATYTHLSFVAITRSDILQGQALFRRDKQNLTKKVFCLSLSIKNKKVPKS